MQYVCEEITASKTVILLGIHRNSVNRYFNLFREKIAASALGAGVLFSGEIELDESYFGAKRIRGKRGRGAAWEDTCFWGSQARWKCLC